MQARAEQADAAREEAEAQLEQLRAQIINADENAGTRIADLEAKLQDALDREERSRIREAAAVNAPSSDPAADERARQIEDEALELRQRAEAAESQVRRLESTIERLEASPARDPAAAVDPAEVEAASRCARRREGARRPGRAARRHRRSDVAGVRSQGAGAGRCRRRCAFSGRGSHGASSRPCRLKRTRRLTRRQRMRHPSRQWSPNVSPRRRRSSPTHRRVRSRQSASPTRNGRVLTRQKREPPKPLELAEHADPVDPEASTLDRATRRPSDGRAGPSR